MAARFWIIWGLCTFVIVIHPVKGESCTISNLGKIDEICTAQIDCLNVIDFDVKTWECIKNIRYERTYDYDYYGNRRSRMVTTYDENYNLIINVTQPKQTSSLLRNEKHFIKLSLENGDLVSIPEDVYKMEKLQELYILGNNIGTVNLNNFLKLSIVKKIRLQNNSIRFIEMDEESELSFGRQISNVQVIDISKNFIEVLPNNFLSRFIQLQHLDLSHNVISSIGLLTFEGIVQLQTLDLSHNRLLGIGHAFARFSNLKELYVSHNNITKLYEHNLITLLHLEKIDASFNAITDIENDTFKSLTKLKYLDLRHNELNSVSKNLFNNSFSLNHLFFCDNRIESIEKNSFERTQVTEFCIQNNPLLGVLKQNTFKGIDVTELNLSGGNLTSIEDFAFANMSHLDSLNISSNFISDLSFSSFVSLISISSLDLSNNQLKTFNISSRDLKNLTKLYLQHNNIDKILYNVFENFASLKELDLSYNDIRQIEPQSFLKLNNIEKLKVKGSNFVNILEKKSLDGLSSLQKLDMSETKTTVFQNESFSGLTALVDLNCSFGHLESIAFNAFLGSGPLKRLTLSYNKLNYFNVNVSTISQIQEIYLDNNNIEKISSDTFLHLNLLRILNISNNKVTQIRSDAFQHLNELMYLDLSSNQRMSVVGNPFKNLSKLYSLSLENNKGEISFENSTASIEVLDFQSCGIRNINKIYIYNVEGLSYLNLSRNEITTIDKDSFRNITTLISLDLSSNKISYIQPGSFLHVRILTQLNLHGNSLATIQFGVFDGIEYLRDLNISSNVLTNFDVKLLPNVSTLSLDDNIITYLNFADFFKTDLTKLSVGGNQISCKVLAELKTSRYAEKFKQILTSNILNYHSENINGISCHTSSNITTNANHIPDNTGFNISPIISTLRNVLEKLTQTLQVITENTHSANEFKNERNNFNESLKVLIESYNKSQILNNYYLSKLTEINNDSNIQLTDIKKYMLNLADHKKELEYDSTSVTKSPLQIDEQYLRSEFQKMLKQEKEALREEFRNALSSLSRGLPAQESLVAHEKDSGDSKTVIYFIAGCLAIMLAVYIGNIVFKQVITSRRSHNSRSRTVISNSIEMD